MRTNIGTGDRVIRIVVGLLLLTWVFVAETDIRWLGLIGFVPILTAMAGWCPAYSIMGINTSNFNRNKAKRA